MHTDRCGNNHGQKCSAKGSRKVAKIQEFTDRITTNVEYEMCDRTGNNWSHWNGDCRFKKIWKLYRENTR